MPRFVPTLAAALFAALLVPMPARAGESAPADSARATTVHAEAEFTLRVFDRLREDGRRSGLRPEADVRRVAVSLEHAFDARFKAEVEIELEHGGLVRDEFEAPVDTTRGTAGLDLGGEVRVEEAAIEWNASEDFEAAAGLLLVPVGRLNTDHDGTEFLGSLRNDVETRIIPSTWSALGVSAEGEVGPFECTLALLEGLDAARISASAGLRDARPQGAHAAMAHPAVAARLEWAGPGGLGAGGSLYTGDAWQGPAPAGEDLHARVTLREAHATLAARGARLAALYVMGSIGDHAALNRVLGLTGTSDAIGSRLFGGYVEAAYDVAPLTWPGTHAALTPFARFELTDTQDGVGAAGTEDPSRHRTALTVGVTFAPRPGLAFKADRQQRHEETDTGTGQWNAAVAFSF